MKSLDATSRRSCLFRSGLVNHESGDRIKTALRLIGGNRVSAVLEDAQIGARNQSVQLLGEFRRTHPIIPTTEDQRGRLDRAQLRAQVESMQDAAGAVRAILCFRREYGGAEPGAGARVVPA